MERAGLSDREAFAAVLNADALGFAAADDGNVRVSDSAQGPALVIRRERQDPPPGAITVTVTIDAGQAAWLACSVVAVEYAANGEPMEPRNLLTPIMKSSTGEFFVETHVGRLVAAGEYTQYFWTLAGAQLYICT
jgi:hypothetical protein